MFTYIPLATIWFRKETLDVIKLWILPLTFMFDFGVFLIWVLSKIDDLGWAGVDGWLRTSGWVLCSLLALLLGSNWCDLWFGFRVRGNILSFFCWIVGDDIGWLAYGTSWIRWGLNHTRSLHRCCDSGSSSILTLQYIATVSSLIDWGRLGRLSRHVEYLSIETKSLNILSILLSSGVSFWCVEYRCQPSL